ncbi:MAG: Nif3-like dinuclear metal center hexameric protein [Bacteroidales bacterium]|jgi:dinuclear metal center YbgI/SA1388 family protein|nr:Nif3-like dinuclear metal center hexameric protein [Bacteroidales bacterium]
MLITDILGELEAMAPLSIQEQWDNAGLQCGNPARDATGALLTLDVTEAVVEEARQHSCNLIIAHHPLIFGGIKKITPADPVGRTLLAAIRNDIVIYAAHTNVDNLAEGVNRCLCDRLGIADCRILAPSGSLRKLVTYIPVRFVRQVQDAVFSAGAGTIGDYDCCGYATDGTGSFRAGGHSRPFVGQVGELHCEPETRFETIFPAHQQSAVIEALIAVHPYEEPAYDIYTLSRANPLVGAGMVGDLPEAVAPEAFLRGVSKALRLPVIRHSRLHERPVRTVAVCGGAGSFLLPDAIRCGADMFLTADLKYHEFFGAENIIIADIGHFESEQFTKDLFFVRLIKKFPTFAFRLSEVNTNPVNYLI